VRKHNEQGTLGVITTNILDAIGSTPLVELRNIVPPDSARVFAKLEWTNPTGGMKDRMAKSVVERAESDGRLRPSGTIVEYTGGTTGVSLAMICAAKGYRFHAVTSDAFSLEKQLTMQAFGAEVTVIPSDNKKITEALIKEMIARARSMSTLPGHWWSDQLTNRDAVAGYFPLGDEIWQQTGGEVDAFVHSVGTAHSLHGVTQELWRHNRGVKIVAVEPAESAVLSGKPSGAHRVEGIGIGFVPPLWDAAMVNEIMTVSTDEAMAMARRLAREEGLFAGTSSGLNVVAALRVAERLGPAAIVVTLMVDSGLRYVSTELYGKS
jgi:cysteine synthase